MKLEMRASSIGALAIVLIAAACGDPETTDTRGYTKAPLEDPTVVIGDEEPGTMAQYGNPRRVVAEVIELPEEAPQPAEPEPTGPTAPVELPAGVTQDMVAQGQTTFSSSTCVACHGPTAGGTGLAPALNDAEWLNIDGSYDAIVELINTGVPTPQQFPAPMPAKGGAPLTDDDVRNIAAYIYSISR